MRKKLWLGICAFLLFLIAASVWIYRSAVLGPDFYRRSLVIDVADARQKGEELEERYLNAHNSAVRNSNWTLEFTDDQLNGWIMSTLVEKYPRFQPNRIENLRTSFEAERIRIAFRVREAVIPVVVSVEVIPYVTSDENHIAFRLETVCTGVIPLPKKQATDQITQALTRAKIPVAWTNEDGRPLGLIPSEFEMPQGIDRKWHVRNIRIDEGKLFLSGTASDVD